MDLLFEIFRQSWLVLVESAPWMLLGFLAAGLLHAFLPADFAARRLGRGSRGIVTAAIVGAPLPLCSCGVVPAAAGLKRQGAGPGSTASFLVATPETGVDSIAVTYALLDPMMTLLRPLSAVFTAIAAGFAVDAVSPEEKAKEEAGPEPQPVGCAGGNCGCGGEDEPECPTTRSKLSKGLDFAAGELMGDVGLWFLGGVLLAGALSALLPPGFLGGLLGGGPWQILVALAASLPFYVCATASTPLAAALAVQGFSPGACLVFLLAGPASNAASLAMVGKLLGRRGLTAYLAAIIACTLGLGLAADALYPALGLSTGDWVAGPGEEPPGVWAMVMAVALLLLILRAVVPKLRKAG
ncbi:SO_0444 family Cu/Zn efflux transporter [Desulfohalovibrio reitneri]|uniref:SO_0444 family Cu/Zn efflux transporter n=1 Tax=Desulfohalovibrio reitneri TaxID=1307759 RepID=UPI001929DC14|nr:SO_0444 family Cu/Zn efflux transporter [Desulfohalovibrio reitneri]